MKQNSSSISAKFILGINCAYHQSSVALFEGNKLVFAVEEERFTRIKHAKSARVDNADQIPIHAIHAALNFADLRAKDLDRIAISIVPQRRLDYFSMHSDGEAGSFGTPEGEAKFEEGLKRIPERIASALECAELKERVVYVSHHRSHALAALYCSGFEDAALLVVDGIGEIETTWLGQTYLDDIACFETIAYPHSLGFLWERAASFCGFGEYGAPKVMGLAAYGDPERFRKQMLRLISINKDSGPQAPLFSIDSNLIHFRNSDLTDMTSLFGPIRHTDNNLPLEKSLYADLAAALQERTDEVLLALVQRLAKQTSHHKLVYSGGVALNCVANTKIEADPSFDEFYVMGAAHDAGTAIGAALSVLGSIRRSESKKIYTPQNDAYSAFLGPVYRNDDCRKALDDAGLNYTQHNWDEMALIVGDMLVENLLIGVFYDRLEFGPRALGHRSVLANPTRLENRLRLNKRIKHRENFRPFAASILEENLDRFFEFPKDKKGAQRARDLMILAYPLRQEFHEKLPAILHADGSCRIQTVTENHQPRYHRLISAFYEKSGWPLVLNTSFNDSEPIVTTPQEAVRTFLKSGLDALVLEDFLVRLST